MQQSMDLFSSLVVLCCDVLLLVELKEEFVEIARLRAWQSARPIHFHLGASEDTSDAAVAVG